MPDGLVLDSAGLSTAFQWQPPVIGDPLGPLPPEFAGLRWPDAPDIGGEVTVSTTAELSAAMQTGGQRIIVAPGVYTLTLVPRSDQRYTLQPGAIIAPSGNTAISLNGAQRIVIRGGEFRGGMYVLSGTSDVLFDGVSIDTKRTGSWADSVELSGDLSRIAMINSTISAERYAAYVQGARDVIFANNALLADGPESTVRLMAVTRAVVVDNRLRNGRKHTFRAHQSSDPVYLARNRLENTGIMLQNLPPDPSVIRAWLIDNTLHHDDGDIGIQATAASVQQLVATGNRAYTSACTANCGQLIAQQPGWTIGDNPRLPYQAP